MTTEATTTTLTQQDVFNRVWNHFIVEKQPLGIAWVMGTQPVDEGDDPRYLVCRYRGDDGMKCAAGLFIPDDTYKPDMESETLYALALNEELKIDVEHLDLLIDLQSAHDDTARTFNQRPNARADAEQQLEYLDMRFRDVATNYKLQVPS